ncbi:hypothetical protein AB1Y20_006445 [Prymnesium parvum]|uniref:Uncharacterized protein n=1 Tax=Prymnesium parvum TaxID=97485 RepID=A0AB34J083_PRYPA
MRRKASAAALAPHLSPQLAHLVGSRGQLAKLDAPAGAPPAPSAVDAAALAARRAKAKAKDVAKKKRRHARLMAARALEAEASQALPATREPAELRQPVEPRASKAERRKAIKKAKKAARRGEGGAARALAAEEDGELTDSRWVMDDDDDDGRMRSSARPPAAVDICERADGEEEEEEEGEEEEEEEEEEAAGGAGGVAREEEDDEDDEPDEELEAHGAFVPDCVTDPADATAAERMVGRRVLFEGLVARQDLNGFTGTLCLWYAGARRWEVEVDKGDEHVRVLSRNIRWLDQAPPPKQGASNVAGGKKKLSIRKMPSTAGRRPVSGMKRKL